MDAKIGSRAHWATVAPFENGGMMCQTPLRESGVVVSNSDSVCVKANKKIALFEYFFSFLHCRFFAMCAHLGWYYMCATTVFIGFLSVIATADSRVSAFACYDEGFALLGLKDDALHRFRCGFALTLAQHCVFAVLPLYFRTFPKSVLPKTAVRAYFWLIVSTFAELFFRYGLKYEVRKAGGLAGVTLFVWLPYFLMCLWSKLELFRFGYYYSRHMYVAYWVVVTQYFYTTTQSYSLSSLMFEITLVISSIITVTVKNDVELRVDSEEVKSSVVRSDLATSWSKIVGFPMFHVADSEIMSVLNGFGAQTTTKGDTSRFAFAGDVVLKMLLASRLVAGKWAMSTATHYSNTAFTNDTMSAFLHYNDPDFTVKYNLQLLGSKSKGTIFEAMLGLAWHYGDGVIHAEIDRALTDGLIAFAHERNSY